MTNQSQCATNVGPSGTALETLDFKAEDKRSIQKHRTLAEKTLPREVTLNTLLSHTLIPEWKNQVNGWRVVKAKFLTIEWGWPYGHQNDHAIVGQCWRPSEEPIFSSYRCEWIHVGEYVDM